MADEVGLAATRQAERQEVVAAIDEAAFAERGELLGDLDRQTGSVERGQGLVGQQVGVLEVAFDPATAPLVDFELDEVVQVALERPAFTLSEPRDLFGMTCHRRELERSQHEGERHRWRHGGDCRHAATSVNNASYSESVTGGDAS